MQHEYWLSATISFRDFRVENVIFSFVWSVMSQCLTNCFSVIYPPHTHSYIIISPVTNSLASILVTTVFVPTRLSKIKHPHCNQNQTFCLRVYLLHFFTFNFVADILRDPFENRTQRHKNQILTSDCEGPSWSKCRYRGYKRSQNQRLWSTRESP